MKIVEQMADRLRKSFDEFKEQMSPEIFQALSTHPDRAGRDELTRAIYHDVLVPGVGNKRAYKDFLSRPRGGVHVMLDLNDFKAVNDMHSYQHGDDAITSAGNAFSLASRANRGKLFRTGGDEFRAHFDKPEQAYSFLRDAQTHMGALLPVGGIHKLSFSAGLGHDPAQADVALHHAKAAKVAQFGDIRTGSAHVGHGKHFVHSLLEGASGPVPVEASPDIPKGMGHPTEPMPMPKV